MNYRTPQYLSVTAVLAIAGCSTAPATLTPAPATLTPVPPTIARPATATSAPMLWEDVTDATIGTTAEWTNKVELADINGDGHVDILFANGGEYDAPGRLEFSRVFLNQGPGNMFKEVTQSVFGSTVMLARVIKVRDVNGDRNADIMVGTTYQTQSRLYLGDGSGNFTEVTDSHLPQIKASIGDLEFGDVDGDRDLDMILADWGPESPMTNKGGRTMLWLNDGSGHFSDATPPQMPDVLVKFSWELEFVDIDNDYYIDVLVSCKRCTGSFLFLNDGAGSFADVTAGRTSHFWQNNHLLEMGLNGDAYLDLVTINDGPGTREHVFLSNQRGGFEDATAQLWPATENLPLDDNMDVFLDFDSDGDADLLIGSLDDPDRLLINDGSGHLKLADQTAFLPGFTSGTLGIALADLNGDAKLDVVQGQGEATFPDKVYLGKDIQPDAAPPVITMVEQIGQSEPGQPIEIRARVHDHKSPTMPHDWQSVDLVWTANGQTHESMMTWYGEYLWQGLIDQPAPGTLCYQICATHPAPNKTCSDLLSVTVK